MQFAEESPSVAWEKNITIRQFRRPEYQMRLLWDTIPIVSVAAEDRIGIPSYKKSRH
jgi:hypothetical protein